MSREHTANSVAAKPAGTPAVGLGPINLGRERQLVYSNPLPDALAHYEREFVESLARIRVRPVPGQVERVEGSGGSLDKARMLLNSVRNPQRNRGGSSPAIQLWPSLGLLDARLWASARNRNMVVVHDPLPLRSQVGFSAIARRLANGTPSRKRPVIVSHSDDAMVQVQRILPRFEHRKILHPVLTTQLDQHRSDEATVVVAGQYKPARDLELLAILGPMLRAHGIRCRIFGRGWPEGLAGWEVTSRFLSESEFDAVLGSAWAVLIPYNHYFQSGVALRAMELGTVSVSRETSFARDLMGSDFTLGSSAVAEDFRDALVTAMDSNIARLRFDAYQQAVDRSWGEALAEIQWADSNE